MTFENRADKEDLLWWVLSHQERIRRILLGKVRQPFRNVLLLELDRWEKLEKLIRSCPEHEVSGV